ncbi:MAG: hypothetical protein ACR2HP_01920 [Ilumatobacteraceae bacterium]
MVLLSEPPPVSGARTPMLPPVARPPLGSEPGVWDALSKGDVAAAAQVFDGHGEVAYAVAHAITRDAVRAEQAVVDAFGPMSPDVRDVLALSIAGRCACTEIAAIMGVDRAIVRRDLVAGLRHAAGARGPFARVASTVADEA